MNNKKVILVVILFIGISFIVYSFANPLTDEEDLSGINTGISEGNNGGNSTIIDNTDPIVDDNKEPEEIKEPEEPADVEEPSTPVTPQVVVKKPTTTPTAPKYYCKVVSEKYYGKNGNVVNYATFVSECDSANPTFALKTSFDEPYVATIGTSKALSDFYNSPSFGVLGGSVTCKNGNAVIQNLNELKAAGVYTITCTANGGNGKSTSVSIPVRIKPVSNTAFALAVQGDNTLTLEPEGNQIWITGSMPEQEIVESMGSKGTYITLSYISFNKLTEEELENANVTIGSTSYNSFITTTADGRGMVSIRRGFNPNKEDNSFKINIDWGDGNGVYTYEIHYYKITVE